MPTFKIGLLDDDELKKLEDTMFKALVRAMRVISKEGLIAGYTPPPAEQGPEPEAPTFGKLMNGGNAHQDEDDEPQQPTKRRSLADLLRTVDGVLPGFVPEEDAEAIMGDEVSARQQLRQWIFSGQVQAIIVRRGYAHSKGLPGKLMVHKQQLITRDQTRKRNATLPPRARMANERAPAMQYLNSD
jgi:hypothetical protein